MSRWHARLAPAAVLCLVVSARVAGAQADGDLRFYAVSYVETSAAGTRDALTALRAYRDATLGQGGCTAVEIFEQIGRPGHWALVETWREQKAFEGRDTAAQQRLVDGTKRIRISGLDQRPYKAIAVAPARGGAGGSAIWVIAHVDVAPNPAVAPMLAQLAEASRREPGNLRFDVLQHTMRANHFTVIEAWKDQAAWTLTS